MQLGNLSRRLGTVVFTALAAIHIGPASAASPTFENDVLPIFEANCVVCHGADSPQKGLDLRTAATIRRGGESGAAIQPGHAEESLLLSKIATGVMPPGEGRLEPDEIERVRLWIEGMEPAGSGNAPEGHPEVTERDILPIIQAGCLACHGKSKQQAGLDLRTRQSMLAGGKSGPAIVLGKPEESLLIKRLDAREMPPLRQIHEASVKSPTATQVATLKNWIAAGAPLLPVSSAAPPAVTEKDRAYWSFVPPERPAVPEVAAQDLVRNEIDAFLLAKLEEKGLSYSPPAEKLKLLRRLHLDVTGTPPSPADIETFLADNRPDAYEREVDRLLDSLEYGERWARHWLDLAGYSDSRGIGFEDKIRHHAWRFRDYVIRSLNSDKPYDLFLTEQLAGDEQSDYKQEPVTQQLIDRLAATGFLRTTPDSTYEPEFAYIPDRMTVVSNTVQVVGSAVMGLTIGCARCHDHKYDPISQRDYYRFSAIFQTAYDPYDWRVPKDRLLDIALDGETEQASKHNAPIEAEIELLEESIEQLEKPYRDKLLARRFEPLAADPRAELTAIANTPEDKRSEEQKQLARKHEDLLDVTRTQLTQAFDELADTAKPFLEELKKKQESLKRKPAIRALVDTGGTASRHYLLWRGEPLAPFEPVEPGVPALFDGVVEPYEVRQPGPDETTSGRRLALARWLTQSRHPLTWRVIVNQLWARRFGRGLVPGPSNFGKAASPPSHPGLLDWLATELVDTGRRLKHIHRLMLTSTAYRQSSGKTKALTEADPENILLGRMPLKRMEAEQLYDSILKVTGRLNPQRFGPPEPVEVNESKEVVPEGTGTGFRRGIYVLQRRTSRVTLMDAYDLPHMTPNCLERRESTVPTQALHMMNGEPIWNHAKHLAGRVIDAAGGETKRQIEEMFQRVLSRPPTAAEVEKSSAVLAELARHWPERLRADGSSAPREWTSRWLALSGFAHTLLNSAEFSYID